MKNPFDSGQIKNYVLLYVSVVVIMILFFIASTLFNKVEKIDKKVFATDSNITHAEDAPQEKELPHATHKFKLLDKAY